MTNNDNRLERLSACELGERVNSKDISPVEVIRYFKDRTEKRNPSINAFVYTRFDYAEKCAEELENRIMKEGPQGIFSGVPFALKDFLPSKKGWTHSHGGVKSLIKTDDISSEFCTAMENLGGIAVGKTNAPAFAFRGTCDNMLYGPTSTPFDIRYNSGGSSGGSAAAVADGLVPIAEGSDGGGSIRIPSSWCGCYGFKPSVGTVPSVCRPDAWAATHPFCFNGGITKTVKDSASLLNVMAHYDPRDPFSLERKTRDYTEEMMRPLKGFRIAYTPDFDIFPTDSEVASAVEKSAMRFREAGASVDRVHFSFRRSALELAQMWCKGICIDTAIELQLSKKAGFDLVKDHSNELPEDFIRWNSLVAKGNILDYYELNLVRTEILDTFQDIFDRYDLIISPTTACLPVLNSDDGNTRGPLSINGTETEPLISYCETYFANFIGYPAASIPCALSKTGLPVGMQIIGRKYRDSDVLAASKTFEDIQPWRDIYDIPFSRKI